MSLEGSLSHSSNGLVGKLGLMDTGCGNSPLDHAFLCFPGRVDFTVTKNRIGSRRQAYTFPWTVVKGTHMRVGEPSPVWARQMAAKVVTVIQVFCVHHDTYIQVVVESTPKSLAWVLKCLPMWWWDLTSEYLLLKCPNTSLLFANGGRDPDLNV